MENGMHKCLTMSLLRQKLRNHSEFMTGRTKDLEGVLSFGRGYQNLRLKCLAPCANFSLKHHFILI